MQMAVYWLLAWADGGAIDDLKTIRPEKLSNYRNLIHEFIEPFGNIEFEEVLIKGKLVFLFHVEQDIERVYKRKDNEIIYLRIDDKNKKIRS
jgi:ATP-dependent DNA helicase RecG